MFTRTMIIYFVAYAITNFLSIVFASKIINDVHYNGVKLFFFTILITIFQFLLEHFFKINILYTIFIYPIIYMFVIYTISKATQLIRVNGFGPAIKTALIMVFLQLCTQALFAWKLAKYFHI